MRKISEHEALKLYDEMLDEVYGEINICGYEYSASNAFKEIDPTAYNCGFSDWCDSEDLEVCDDADSE